MVESTEIVEQVPKLDPELYEPLTRADISYILQPRLSHEEELQEEGITPYEFETGLGGGKWHDTSGRSVFEVMELCERNDAGALVMKPGAHTLYIQFKLHRPKGPSQVCNCNECWGRFWIAPFSSPGECPFCHAPGRKIHHQPEFEFVPSTNDGSHGQK